MYLYEKKTVPLHGNIVIGRDITMDKDMTEKFLQKHGIKPTAVRVLVWEEARQQSETFCLSDMEKWMPTMDRSSIFRALRLFTVHNLLHVLDDGTGQHKYCVCRCGSERHINHVHFTCTNCGKTYCLEDYAIPMVDMPKGFVMNEVEYIVKGVCANCAG